MAEGAPLNLALDALPGDCTKVAWIDCDVIFGEDDWPARASRLLDRVPIAQLFSRVHYLPADASPDDLDAGIAEAQGVSFTHAAASGTETEAYLEGANRRIPGLYSLGLAWAASRELLQRHRFYDASVLGGGDRALAAAAYGRFAHNIRYQGLNERQAAHYLGWAKPFHDAIGGRVGSLDGDLCHLWHGALEHRGWGERYGRLAPFRFDPYRDIVLTGEGVWCWGTDKPDMHAHVREHFVRRREDG